MSKLSPTDKELMEVAEACAAQRCSAPMEDYLEARRDAIPAKPDSNSPEFGGIKSAGGAAVTDEAKDAARYRGWRDCVLSGDDDGAFVAAVQEALPPDADIDRAPTAAEWDSAIDVAIEAHTRGKEN